MSFHFDTLTVTHILLIYELLRAILSMTIQALLYLCWISLIYTTFPVLRKHHARWHQKPNCSFYLTSNTPIRKANHCVREGDRSTHSVLDGPSYSRTFVARLFLPQIAFSSREDRGFLLMLFLQIILAVKLLGSGWSPGGRGAPHNHGGVEEHTSFSSICLPASRLHQKASLPPDIPSQTSQEKLWPWFLSSRVEGKDTSFQKGKVFSIYTIVD